MCGGHCFSGNGQVSIASPKKAASSWQSSPLPWCFPTLGSPLYLEIYRYTVGQAASRAPPLRDICRDSRGSHRATLSFFWGVRFQPLRYQDLDHLSYIDPLTAKGKTQVPSDIKIFTSSRNIQNGAQSLEILLSLCLTAETFQSRC